MSRKLSLGTLMAGSYQNDVHKTMHWSEKRACLSQTGEMEEEEEKKVVNSKRSDSCYTPRSTGINAHNRLYPTTRSIDRVAQVDMTTCRRVAFAAAHLHARHNTSTISSASQYCRPLICRSHIWGHQATRLDSTYTTAVQQPAIVNGCSSPI